MNAAFATSMIFKIYLFVFQALNRLQVLFFNSKRFLAHILLVNYATRQITNSNVMLLSIIQFSLLTIQKFYLSKDIQMGQDTGDIYGRTI